MEKGVSDIGIWDRGGGVFTLFYFYYSLGITGLSFVMFRLFFFFGVSVIY